MIKLTLSQISDARNLGGFAFDGIVELMQKAINDGETIEIEGEEIIIIKTQNELDAFTLRFN
jgi:hypothetical protein